MARRPTIKIKNFESYQHYKHRNPPWIKLHLSLLDDPDFLRLPDASKWHYIGLLLLASRHGNDILNDPLYINNRLGITEKLDLSKRFLKEHVLASNASVLHTNADSEKSRDRVELETHTAQDRNPSPPSRQEILLRLESFQITDAMRVWARQEFNVEIPDDTLAEFKDHWRNEKKLRTDWVATFKNRIRQLVSWGTLRPKPQSILPYRPTKVVL